MKKKKKKQSAIARNPVTRLAKYHMDVNGPFTIVTDLIDDKVFDKVYREWFDHPTTRRWCGESLVGYIKAKFPNKICLLEQDYLKIEKSAGVVHATKEEWEAENN